jgi:large subunit ribosomal protein L9
MKSKRLLHAKKTHVLLLSKIRGLGKRGEGVYVANGYFRNYLMPRDLACRYNEEKQKQLQSSSHESENHKDIVDLLENKVLFFGEQANTLGVLFNSLKKKNIVQNILDSYSMGDRQRLIEVLEKSKIAIDPPIKNIGTHPIIIEVGDEVINMKVSVARSIEEAKGGF